VPDTAEDRASLLGRAVHIHVKVHVRGTVVHTGQLFFPASVTNVVYKRAPTARTSDSIFCNSGSKGLLTLKKNGSGYVGTIGMGAHLT